MRLPEEDDEPVVRASQESGSGESPPQVHLGQRADLFGAAQDLPELDFREALSGKG